MPYLVKALGILFLAIGIVFFLRPQLVKAVIEFFKVGKRIYIGGGIRIVIGALLLISIPHVTFPLITGIIGALMVVAGIIFLALGLQKMHQLLDWIYSKSDKTYRIAACAAGAVGILLIYSA